MGRRKSRRVRAISIFVAALALATAYYTNSFKPTRSSIDSREADRRYDKLDNDTKVFVEMRTGELEKLRFQLNRQMDALGGVKIHNQESGAYSLLLYRLEPKYINNVLDNLTKLGTVLLKNETNNPMLKETDLELKLKDKQMMYQRELQDYNNARFKTSYQLGRINLLSREIDSLKIMMDNQKYRQQSILYVKAIVPSGPRGAIKNYQKFTIDFFKYLLLFFAITLLLYFGIVLLTYVLTMIGIRFPSGAGGYGGYRGYRGYSGYSGYRGYSGYGKYGYNYNKRRRIKRIYKNRSQKPSQSQGEQQEEN